MSLSEKKRLLAQLLKRKAAGFKDYPLSFAQQRLWFMCQLAPDSAFYNIPAALRLTSAVEGRLLDRCLGEIVRRHAVLRTTFPEVEGQAVQRVHPQAEALASRVDLSGLPPQERESAARRLVEQASRRPFDLSKGPLFRFALLELGPADKVLLLVIHHIAADGWSLGVLLRELSLLYPALAAGESSPLPELEIQYADFAAWQRRTLQGRKLEDLLRFWRDRFEGLSALVLPADRPRPEAATFRGARCFVSYPKALRERLAELSRPSGCTLFMTVLAAFFTLLHRYSGQSDIAIGSPIANRTRSEIEGLIGFFVNTLVLRADLSGDPTFLQLLKRVQGISLQAFANQDLPFERLVEELQPERDLSRNPLVQVLFALQNAPDGGPPWGRQGMESLEIERGTANFDLVVDLWETPQGLGGRFEYSTELFEAPTIQRWSRHFRVLLEGIAQDPGKRLRQYSLLPEAERRQLTQWAGVRSEFPRQQTLERLFQEQAVRTPEAAALEWGETLVTYRQLDAAAQALASRLIELGVKPGELVALRLDRRPLLVVALLAVLKAGAGYVPLDKAHPCARRISILQDTGSSLLLTEPEEGRLDGFQGRVLPLDWNGMAAAEAAVSPSTLSASSGQTAYVMYTSGSSGRPKGICIPHRAVVRLVLGADYAALGPDERVAMIANPAFDASTFEIWGALLNGACLVIAQREVALSPSDFARFLRQRKITAAFLTTALFNQIASAQPDAFRNLRHLLIGGEAADPRRVREVQEGGPPQRLLNAYGPTENTTFSTWHAVSAEVAADRPVPIGLPIRNTQAYVLDRYMQRAPIGVAGELFLGGDGLASGYLKRPRLTAQRFVPSPFPLPDPDPSEGGQRLYRSGDLVRRRSDGNLEFIGRLDTQVKIRGHRIELGEIEAALCEHPQVLEAIALDSPDPSGTQRLAAYIVPDGRFSGSDDSGRERRVEEWRQVYDEMIYQDVGRGGVSDRGFNIAGWMSSYTGQPISRAEMRQQVEQTTARIQAGRPSKVLEIGCGTGLLLFPTAPACREYWATDFSQTVLDELRRRLDEKPLPGVRLLHRSAHDFSDLPNDYFDCVVLNSVIQYFPDQKYLERVLAGALNAVADGGSILLGDVRNLALLEAFHSAVELYRAPDDLPAGQLRRRVEQRLLQEDELLADPAFFLDLPRKHPRIGAVEVMLKRGNTDNELTQFRCDVRLRIGPAEHADLRWRDWELEFGSLSALRRCLDESAPRLLALQSVPNARTAPWARAFSILEGDSPPRSAADVRASVRESQAIQPEDIWKLADEASYSAQLLWSGSREGRFHVVLSAQGEGLDGFPPAAAIPAEGGGRATNDPMAGRRVRRLKLHLPEFLESRLPDYMIPSAFVPLSALPLNSNGKVDRRGLPPPDWSDGSSRNPYAAPRNAVEKTLAGLWADVLGVERVGIHDDFFKLGGHSLLVAQLVSRIRTAFEMELPLRQLFRTPTVAEFASEVFGEAADRPHGANGEAFEYSFEYEGDGRIPKSPSGASAPASYSQERLWFLERLFPGSPVYHIPAVLAFTSQLDASSLERSLHEIARRHAVLRTTFEQADGRLLQRIAETPRVPFQVRDLRALDASRADGEARRLALEVARQPFDLEKGPLLRALLLRFSQEDRLLLVIHHVAADGWSLGILFKELKSIYPAFASGDSSPLPELPVQYADYAVWLRDRLSGVRLSRLLAYWKKQLSGVPPLFMPTDRPRPAVPSYRGAQIRRALPSSLSSGLIALGQREGCTLFMTLTAAFASLLSRHSGQCDFAVGSPVANRGRAELEGMIGFFLNTLVLRMDLEGEPGFRSLLSRVRETCLEAFAHQELPFEMLLEELRPERNLGRTPLFQVFLNLLNFSDTDVSAPVLRSEGSLLGEVFAQFEMALYAGEVEGRVLLQLVYCADLFDESTVDRFLAQLETLLAAALADPEKRVSQLDLISEQDRLRLAALPEGRCRSGAEPARSGEAEHSVAERFAHQAAIHAARPALGTDDGSLNYGELHEAVQRMAGELRRHAGPRERIGLLLGHHADMIAAVMGALTAGMAYVPLDPRYPQDRLKAICGEAGIGLLLSEADLAQRAQELAGRSVPLLICEKAFARPRREVQPRISLHDLAYILFTSGSMGAPKGVAQSHRNLLHHAGAYARSLGIEAEDRLALLASFAFDASVMDIFGALLSGASLYPIDLRNLGLPQALAKLRRERITILHATPTVFRCLMECAQEGSQAMPLPDIRFVVLGGEEVRRSDWELFRRHFPPDAILVNGLGPTESTTALQHFLDGRKPIVGNSVPVGYPVAGTDVLVLNGEGRPAAPYEVGEILICSDHLALGYWRRPSLTASFFVPDPLGGKGRCYRTGDLGRLMEDGSVEYAGRADRQIKIRGQRVEPAEVEARLCEHPAVRQAAVISYEAADGPALAAYVVLDSQERPAPDGSRLRRYLRQQLPEASVPAEVIEVEELSLTATDKVDRSALPAPDPRRNSQRTYVPARSETESVLVGMIEELLGLEGVGVHDDFFQIGGHSLLATRFLMRICDSLGADIPLRSIFLAPTAAELAEIVEASRSREQRLPDAPIVALDREAYRLKTL